jgi:hypothetical protein
LIPLALAGLLLAAGAASAQTDLVATLHGNAEVPVVSSFAKGTFTGTLNEDFTELAYTLEYAGAGNVLQAHIHIGQAGVNGGITIFFCTNLGNGPAGTPACPADSASLSGTATAADVVGPAGQGVPAGNFFRVQRALRQGVAYANVHTPAFPGGEIRGQIRVVPAP